MPDFLIIGAQKGGTSSLFSYLSHHPRIALQKQKEIHFFDYNFDRGMDWYLGCFPDTGRGKSILTGEASPYYLFHPLAPRRIFECLPDVRLIVLLRDPVTRAYSHYMMERNRGNEPLASFREALAAEPARLEGEAEKIIAGQCGFNFNHQMYSYAARGLYFKQLQEWRRYFSPQRFLVLKSESFFEKPGEVVLQVHRFLQVEPILPENLQAENVNTYPPLPDDERKELRSYFLDDSRKLKEMFGEELAWDD